MISIFVDGEQVMGGFFEVFSIIGIVLAAVICWNRTYLVTMTALAAFFSWFYVLYYVFFIRPAEEEEEMEEDDLEEERTISRPDKGFY